VGNEEAGATVVGEEFFLPFNRFRVEVVGRLVEDEEIGLGDERTA